MTILPLPFICFLTRENASEPFSSPLTVDSHEDDYEVEVEGLRKG